MRSIACVEISFQGCGGYMKYAFWICSWISSSSLKGNVPEINIVLTVNLILSDPQFVEGLTSFKPLYQQDDSDILIF